MLHIDFISNVKKFLKLKKQEKKSHQWYDEPFVFEPKTKGFRVESSLMYYACDRGMKAGSLTCFWDKEIGSHTNSLMFNEKTKDIIVFSIEKISSTQYFIVPNHIPDLEEYWKKAYKYKFEDGNLKLWLHKNDKNIGDFSESFDDSFCASQVPLAPSTEQKQENNTQAWDYNVPSTQQTRLK